jgi:hypothetical protein
MLTQYLATADLVDCNGHQTWIGSRLQQILAQIVHSGLCVASPKLNVHTVGLQRADIVLEPIAEVVSPQVVMPLTANGLVWHG